MGTGALVRPNMYYDSVTLMALTKHLKAGAGVHDVVVSMGTENNLDLLRNVGMLTEDAAAATPADLVIAYDLADDGSLDGLIKEIDGYLRGGREEAGEGQDPASLDAALASAGADLAVISVPGTWAAREARRALARGLNVMIFSDNVSLEDEVDLKMIGHEAGLLVMGPDCGTAIINGVGLCFANAVRRGPIGVVGASGTGTQEVTVLVDRYGAGVSQAIGTGGRDVSAAVGGRMVVDGIDALAADDATRVITIVSKPPAKEAMAAIVEAAGRSGKPVVACLLGAKGVQDLPANVEFAATLEEGAARAVELATGSTVTRSDGDVTVPRPSRGRYVRALYCGGTLCDEARLVFADTLPSAVVRSNVAKDPAERLGDSSTSQANTFLDLGEDEFTVGKPHPMIEPSLRNDRLVAEASDPETAVVLLDVMLGFGSHPDPAGETLAGIRAARAAGHDPLFIAYVCGTDADPQNLVAQRAALAAEGVVLAYTNAAAARLAARYLEGLDR